VTAYYNEFDPKAAARVGRLRGYGNAINAEAAKAFIESYLNV
jgi:DNA (cytosine-5)-methyltransferase 1